MIAPQRISRLGRLRGGGADGIPLSQKGATDGVTPLDANGIVARSYRPDLDVSNVKDHGAVGNGVADDTQAFVDAIAEAAGGTVSVPAGDYRVDVLSIVGPINLVGAGMARSIIRNTDGSVLSIRGSYVNVSHLTLRSDGGGPTVTLSGLLGQGNWHHVELIQTSGSQSIWSNALQIMVDMRFDHLYSQHTQTATVPGWNLVGPGGTINDNVWTRFRAQNSGNYHFWVESTTANAQYFNVWRDATWEVCTGGLIRLISVNNYVIDGGANWDMDSGTGGVTTLQRHGIYATANAYNITCFGTIRWQSRYAGHLANGIYDAVLPSNGLGGGTVVEHCNTVSNTDPWTVDLVSNRATVRRTGWMSYLRSTYATVIDYTKTECAFDGVLRTGRGATASRPDAAVAGSGAVWYDETVGMPLWSNGTAWSTNSVFTDSIYLPNAKFIRWRNAANSANVDAVYLAGSDRLGLNSTVGVSIQVNGSTRLAVDNSVLTFTDAVNIACGSTTGTKIGTATTQKIGLWDATPNVQPTNAIAGAAYVANAGIDTATFGGYTIGQVVAALKRLGALA